MLRVLSIEFGIADPERRVDYMIPSLVKAADDYVHSCLSFQPYRIVWMIIKLRFPSFKFW